MSNEILVMLLVFARDWYEWTASQCYGKTREAYSLRAKQYSDVIEKIVEGGAEQ